MKKYQGLQILFIYSTTFFKCLMGRDRIFLFFIFYFVVFLRAAPAAYGGSQARGLFGAVAAGLCHSHSNSGSKPCLQPTLERVQGSLAIVRNIVLRLEGAVHVVDAPSGGACFVVELPTPPEV